MATGQTWGASCRHMAAYQEAVPRPKMNSEGMSGVLQTEPGGQWKPREVWALRAEVIEAGFKQVGGRRGQKRSQCTVAFYLGSS